MLKKSILNFVWFIISSTLFAGEPLYYQDSSHESQVFPFNDKLTGRNLSQSGKGEQPVVKKVPEIRITPLEQINTSISLAEIAPFLIEPLVFEKDVFETSPYIAAAQEGRLITTTGDLIYVHGIKDKTAQDYTVFRPGTPYQDPISREILGVPADILAKARLEQYGGEISTLRLTEAKGEVLPGDKLIANQSTPLNAFFTPHIPNRPITGQLIAVYNAIAQIGQGHTVIINRGQRDGVEIGHLFTVTGQTIQVAGKPIGSEQNPKGESEQETKSWLNLPEQSSGTLLVYATYQRISFALVVQAFYPIHIFDKIKNPSS